MTRNALQNWRLSRIQLKLKEEEEEESGSSEPHHQVNANYNRKQGEKISNIRLFSPPQILTIQTHTQLKKQKTRMPMAKNSLQSHILSQIHFKFQKHKKKNKEGRKTTEKFESVETKMEEETNLATDNSNRRKSFPERREGVVVSTSIVT